MYTNKEQREKKRKKKGLYRNFKCTNFYVALKTYRVLHVALLERCPDLLISVFIKGVQVVPAGMGVISQLLIHSGQTNVRFMGWPRLPDCTNK